MRLDFNLAAQLQDPIGRQLKNSMALSALRIIQANKFSAPDRHAGPRRGDQSLAPQEDARVHYLKLRPAGGDHAPSAAGTSISSTKP